MPDYVLAAQIRRTARGMRTMYNARRVVLQRSVKPISGAAVYAVV